MDDEIIKIFKNLPQKHIRDKKDSYLLTIVKNERDGNDNAWIVMYAKENCKSLSTVKTKIKVEGATFFEALQKMEVAYKQYKQERNIQTKINNKNNNRH